MQKYCNLFYNYYFFLKLSSKFTLIKIFFLRISFSHHNFSVSKSLPTFPLPHIYTPECKLSILLHKHPLSCAKNCFVLIHFLGICVLSAFLIHCLYLIIKNLTMYILLASPQYFLILVRTSSKCHHGFYARISAVMYALIRLFKLFVF